LLLIAATGHPEVIRAWEGNLCIASTYVTFSWAEVEGAVNYQVEAIWIDPITGNSVAYNIGTVTETSIRINKPRIGFFIFRVRACNLDLCSEWSETTDESKTKEEKPIRVFFGLVPSSGAHIQ
jgi:hypothetical protein